MSLLKKFQYWKLNKSRTEAFSDGVFAIIITLLILEIKIPHLVNKTSGNELMWALINLAPKILSWAVSFFFIAIFWVQHHNLFRLADKIDYAFVWLNIFTLLFICFVPFPTAIMGEYPANRMAVLFFGAVVSIASFLQTCMYYYLTKYYLVAEYDKTSVKKNVRRSFILAPLLLLVATGVSFIHVFLPYFIYAVVPFFFLLPFDKEKGHN